jgi:hypothetical protein
MHSQARDSFQIIHTQRGRSNDSPIKDEDSKVLRDSHWVGPTEWEEESDLNPVCVILKPGGRGIRRQSCVFSPHTHFPISFPIYTEVLQMSGGLLTA